MEISLTITYNSRTKQFTYILLSIILHRFKLLSASWAQPRFNTISKMALISRPEDCEERQQVTTLANLFLLLMIMHRKTENGQWNPPPPPHLTKSFLKKLCLIVQGRRLNINSLSRNNKHNNRLNWKHSSLGSVSPLHRSLVENEKSLEYSVSTHTTLLCSTLLHVCPLHVC